MERAGHPHRRFLLGALAIALVLRLQSLLWPLTPDEAGFLLVSREWAPGGDSLYGSLFVDRTPVLIAAFRLGDAAMGDYGPRVLAGAAVLLLIAAAYRCGLLLGGVTSARWAAVVAVALSGQPQLSMWAAKGESLGVPLVMAGCWQVLEALRAQGWRRLGHVALAGLCAGLAVGMKQSLLGALVFGAVVLGVTAGRRDLSRRRLLALAAAGLAGLAVPVVTVVAWAAFHGVDLETLWHTSFGFRRQALEVATSGSAPQRRLIALGVLVVTSGLAFLVWVFVLSLRAAASRNPPVVAAVAAMLVVDGVALLMGGSYWLPYLAGLLPGTVLAVALASAPPMRHPHALRVAAGFAVASTVLHLTGWLVGDLREETVPVAHELGGAIGAVAAPEDSIVVLYGRPDLVEGSGLRTPYRHLWSLPMRTLDPEQHRLRAVLAGPAAPTWVVGWSSIGSWGMDPDRRIRTLLEQRYDLVARRCGVEVWKRSGVVREALGPVRCPRR